MCARIIGKVGGVREPNSPILGRQILRRLVDQWERFDYTLKAFRNELQRAGMDARGRDTFGTLLACADIIEFDGWNEERLHAPSDGDMKPWSEPAVAPARLDDAAEN